MKGKGKVPIGNLPMSKLLGFFSIPFEYLSCSNSLPKPSLLHQFPIIPPTLSKTSLKQHPELPFQKVREPRIPVWNVQLSFWILRETWKTCGKGKQWDTFFGDSLPSRITSLGVEQRGTRPFSRNVRGCNRKAQFRPKHWLSFCFKPLRNPFLLTLLAVTSFYSANDKLC